MCNIRRSHHWTTTYNSHHWTTTYNRKRHKANVCGHVDEFSYLILIQGMGKIKDNSFMEDGARFNRTQQTFDLLAEHFINSISWLNSEKKTRRNSLVILHYGISLRAASFYGGI